MPLYAAKIRVWQRWFTWFFGFVILAYRPAPWHPEDIEFVLLSAVPATVIGLPQSC